MFALVHFNLLKALAQQFIRYDVKNALIGIFVIKLYLVPNRYNLRIHDLDFYRISGSVKLLIDHMAREVFR